MLLCVNSGNWIHVNANATHAPELFIVRYASEKGCRLLMMSRCLWCQQRSRAAAKGTLLLTFIRHAMRRSVISSSNEFNRQFPLVVISLSYVVCFADESLQPSHVTRKS